MSINPNTQNRDIMSHLIAIKTQYNRPHYATIQSAQEIITPFDAFPYKYWFRGQYDKSYPVVAERTAGFRPRHDWCYKEQNTPNPCKAGYCWQYPCSSIWPCRPNQEIMSKQVDMGEEECEGRCGYISREVNISP